MDSAIENFLAARERYEELQNARVRHRSPEERERYHIELMRAWLDVHHHAQVTAGLRFAGGIRFAEVN